VRVVIGLTKRAAVVVSNLIMTGPPPRSPAVVDVAALLAIVVGSAVVVRAGGGATVVGSWALTAIAALVCGLVFGLPVLAFTLERGRATPAWMLALGAVAGALPLLLLGVSGLIGLYVRSGGWERVVWALERGVPVPGAGVIFWSRFLRLELQATLLGLGCALMFWLVVVRARPDSRAFHILLALFVLGTVAAVAALLR
jgi:hypothetical protein